jgi:hypothetical protein
LIAEWNGWSLENIQLKVRGTLTRSRLLNEVLHLMKINKDRSTIDRDQNAGDALHASVNTCDGIVSEALHSVRILLGMEIAFVSEFRDGRRIFRYVDSEEQSSRVRVGGSDPVEETYCQRILDGRLPELLESVVLNQEALSLPITADLGIGVYLGVPIRFSDGSLYGTFCCFSARSAAVSNDHPLTTLRLFANFVARVLERQSVEHPHKELRERLQKVVSNDLFTKPARGKLRHSCIHAGHGERGSQRLPLQLIFRQQLYKITVHGNHIQVPCSRRERRAQKRSHASDSH